MHTLLPWLAVVLGLLGNCGWWLFCFNRVNAFGYPRFIAKLAEKFCIASCFAIPVIVFYADQAAIRNWLFGVSFWPTSVDLVLQTWLISSFASLITLTPLWLESRRWLKPPSNLVNVHGELHNVHQSLDGGSANNLKTRLWSRIPFNDWGHIEVTHKLLRLPRTVSAAEGLTIGHISDLHFTGQYTTGHYKYVVQKLTEHKPNLIVISGDIIDFQHCMPYIDAVLDGLSAPLGCYFVLGNHERRLEHVPSLVERLTQIGFIDLGIEDRIVVTRGLKIQLKGNESPWFDRRLSSPGNQIRQGTNEVLHVDSAGETFVNSMQPTAKVQLDEQFLRLGVSHTPDRIRWARREKIDLLLAGHTHGGQARFPLIGPLVAPSIYGSKFASGVFYLPPTLMHVSRGVAGTHTIRWRCPPEISILQLTNSSEPQSPVRAG